MCGYANDNLVTLKCTNTTLKHLHIRTPSYLHINLIPTQLLLQIWRRVIDRGYIRRF